LLKIKSLPPHRNAARPSLSPKGARGKGSRSSCCSEPEFDSIDQVGVTRKNNSVSPLSLRERVRVRGLRKVTAEVAE
jgi:hypothetical protein